MFLNADIITFALRNEYKNQTHFSPSEHYHNLSIPNANQLPQFNLRQPKAPTKPLKMKYLTLASLILPLTSSMPTSSDLQIRNPQEIARLVSINNDIHERLLNGQVVSLDKRGDVQLDKRIIQVAGLAGVALIEAIGAGVDITAGLAGNLLSIFTGDDQDQIWKNHGHCRVNFQTDDGSICDLKSYARDSADATGDHHWAGLDK